jgi:hypothetical protein
MELGTSDNDIIAILPLLDYVPFLMLSWTGCTSR